MTIALIDADVLKYSCAFAVEKYDKETDMYHVEPVHHAYYNIKAMINKCLNRLKTTEFECFVTARGTRNFRLDIYGEYKANRAIVRRPIYYDECHEYLVHRWGAKEAHEQEADDAISIRHQELNQFGYSEDEMHSVICSLDKDFNNRPGWHYNFRKDELYYVTEVQALRNFYLQILTGDKADNVPRIKQGWRQGKAEEAIMAAETEKEMLDIVKKEAYNIGMNDKEVNSFILRNGQLLWLRTRGEELWQLPETN